MKNYSDAVAEQLARQETQVERVNRAAAAAGWAPHAPFERSIRIRERDPGAHAAFLAGDSSGFGGELALYEAGREAAIEAGTFDPATYQEDAP